MFWREFRTKDEAIAAFQDIINPMPFGVPFENVLLTDLISEKHYFCSRNNFRPARFRKLPGYGAYTFQGEFPVIGWHTVSWLKCIKKPLTGWDYLVRAMRDHAQEQKQAHRDAHETCELCGRAPSKETHHANPEFREITRTLREQVSDAEIDDCLADWNWLREDNFKLPPGHKITRMFEEIHAGATLQAVCTPCHNLTKKKGSIKALKK